ncbi:MAG: hypothetical protein M1118_09430 [Chloroflexi bacterium]|nr:hypothetical protein [Chloroflexota bacterium]
MSTVKLSLLVRLIIPDTAAISARRALQRHPRSGLEDLLREIGWEFETDLTDEDELAKLAERLTHTDVLVNYNKHRVRWIQGGLQTASRPSGAPLQRVAGILVTDLTDGETGKAEHILQARLGFAGVHVVRRSTLWWVVAYPDASPLQVAQHARDQLLVNAQSQRSCILSFS